jgi:hypothetical protein
MSENLRKYPSVDDAYWRAKKNCDSYRFGKWLNQWWVHPLEAVACQHVQISIMKECAESLAKPLFEKAYLRLIDRLEAGGRIELDVIERGERKTIHILSHAENKRRLNTVLESLREAV